MDERARAIHILKQTRDILAQRLIERILEAEEEILAEAEGHSFLSEIETIYDQIGLRLAHVNQMLGQLPAAPEPAPSQRQTPAWRDKANAMQRQEEAGNDSSSAASPEVSISTFLALPAPGKTECRVDPLASTTLLMFAVHARRGEWEAAALSLESLFGLSREQALASTRVFHGHCGRDPSYVENAARLHNYLQADALSRAFGLMCESFGLSGGEALSALMWWRTRSAQ